MKPKLVTTEKVKIMKSGKDKNEIKLFFKFLTYIKNIEPKIFISFFFVTVASSLNTILIVYLPKIVIDGVMGDWTPRLLGKNLLVYSALIIMSMLVKEIANYKFIKDRGSFSYKLYSVYSMKVLNLKYELLEDTEILDLNERAQYPLNQMLIFGMLDNIKDAGIALARLIGVGGILASFNIWIMIFTIIMCLIGGFLLEKNSKINEAFANDLMPINRRYNYYLGLLVRPELQKEFRLYELNDLIEDKMKTYMEEIEKRFKDIFNESRKIETASQSMNSISRLVIYFYTALRALGIGGKIISLGNFSIVITASEQFSQSITRLIDTVVAISRDIRFVKPLFEFYELEEYGTDDKGIKAEPLKTLEFKNVSFTYPKTDKVILNNISFKLDKGETLALVGRNNAGKSTLVKLIARLFEPDEGEILWNGVNIKDLELKSYLKELAYVFQDFQLFPFQIWENIASYSNGEGNVIPNKIESKVMDCIKRVNMEDAINELPSGLNTWLNKNLHENSTEFSGGERQKLAMARAVYKDASFAILDEPTAALDPLAESEVYANFSNLVKDKTALFISHRMSASRFCDRILVLDNGTIIGNGNHEELLKTNSLYHSLYQAQAQYYEEVR